jgi:hypothetical protein
LATDETCHAQIAVRRQPVAPASAMASAIKQPSRARPERDFQCVAEVAPGMHAPELPRRRRAVVSMQEDRHGSAAPPRTCLGPR